MKKHTLYYIALSALAMLTGCSNEENFGLKPTDGNRSLTATIEQNDLSRTAVSEEGQVTWTETDAIGVFGTASQNIRFTYQSSTDNGNSATFRGDFPEEETMEQAYYPYQENATLSGNALTLHLPSEYTYTGNSNAPMLGVKNNDGTFTFKHLCGLMQVKLTSIPSKSAQFVITSEGETIAGTAVVDNIDASNATLHIKENEQASNTIIYHINSTDFTEEELTFHIPLPVGEYEKLTVMLKDENNNILFQKSISNATIKRAVILSMPILDCENNISYVLNEQTIQLNKQDESYIESVTEEGDGTSDENAIVYSLDTPADKLPKVGQILLCNEITEKFPSGFLGKVTAIEENNSGYTIHTGPATLNEAFKQLHVNQTFDLIPIENDTPQSRAESQPDEDGFFTFEKKFEVSSDPEAQNYHYHGEATFGLKLYVRIDIDEDIPPMAVMTLQTKAESELNFGLDLKGEITRYLPIGPELAFTAIPAGVVITPSLQLYFVVNAQGEFGFDTTINIGKQMVSGIEYKNDTWQAGGNNIGDDGLFGWGLTDSTRVTLEGSAFAGLGLDMSLQLFNNDNLRVGIEPKLGLEASATMSFDMSVTGETDLYEELKDANIKSGLKLQTDAIANANIFDGSNPWEKTIHEHTYWEKAYYLFPLFENPTLETSNENLSAVVTYDVTRDLLFNSEIGVTLFKEDEWAQETDEENYRWENEYANPLMGAFEELETNVNYKAVPYVVWGDLFRFYAQPEETFILEDDEEDPAPETPLIVTTGESTNVTLTNATLSGSLTNMQPDETYTYGFIYSTDKGNVTIDNGTKVEVSVMEENRTFSTTLTLLEENMTYYWCAYACDGAGNYTYGDVEIFATIELTPEEKKERDILIAFYKATGGDNWNRNNYWCTAQPLKNWYGVGISPDNGKVISISLLGNDLTGHADLRGLQELKSVELSSNNIESVNVSGLEKLEYLRFRDNSSSATLNAAKCINLEEIDCQRSQLTDINMSGLINLKQIDCSYNQLTQLNVSGLNNLVTLICTMNRLTQLDISGLNNLVTLNCSHNQLTQLDVSDLNNLVTLGCTRNQLTQLDVSDLNNLTSLGCGENSLTYLNTDGCINLKSLSCDENKGDLSNFDFSKLTNLETLSVANCKLTSLNVSTLKNLTDLSCCYNNLTTLDVSNLTKLTSLYCHKNSLTNIDVSMLSDLTNLRCDNNQLTNLDVSNLEKLEDLDCSHNPLKKLDVSNLKKLSYLRIENSHRWTDEAIEFVDLTNISSPLRYFSAYGSLIKKVYLSSQEENYEFWLWGDVDEALYFEPNHKDSYQYPEFIYK